MKKSDAFFHLLTDWFGFMTIFGAEGLVVTIRAATRSFASIAVGTGEAGIDGYFLNSFGKFGF